MGKNGLVKHILDMEPVRLDDLELLKEFSLRQREINYSTSRELDNFLNDSLAKAPTIVVGGGYK